MDGVKVFMVYTPTLTHSFLPMVNLVCQFSSFRVAKLPNSMLLGSWGKTREPKRNPHRPELWQKYDSLHS